MASLPVVLVVCLIYSNYAPSTTKIGSNNKILLLLFFSLRIFAPLQCFLAARATKRLRLITMITIFQLHIVGSIFRSFLNQYAVIKQFYYVYFLPCLGANCVNFINLKRENNNNTVFGSVFSKQRSNFVSKHLVGAIFHTN